MKRITEPYIKDTSLELMKNDNLSYKNKRFITPNFCIVDLGKLIVVEKGLSYLLENSPIFYFLEN